MADSLPVVDSTGLSHLVREPPDLKVFKSGTLDCSLPVENRWTEDHMSAVAKMSQLQKLCVYHDSICFLSFCD